MQQSVDRWSSPTTVYTGGLRQLPAALDGRPMVLVADGSLTSQIELVVRVAPPVAVLELTADGAPDDRAEAVIRLVRTHRSAVPVALGGGSIMDLVRLAALAAADPSANGFQAPPDGPTVLPTRALNPTICIPSTLGTAAEVSPVAIRATPAGTALILSPGLRGSAAIVDPRMTSTLHARSLAAGLVEPLARVCVPAVAGEALVLQDEIACALVRTLLTLGDEAAGAPVGDAWRTAAALASAQTHLSVIALGRAPAGHALWPLATEVVRATGLPKSAALAALVPAWLRCVHAGVLSRTWGTPSRVRQILGVEAGEAADRLESWLRRLSLPTLLPAGFAVDAVTKRVVHPWQDSGLFLTGVAAEEISAVLAACSAGAGDRGGGSAGQVVPGSEAAAPVVVVA